MQALQSLTKSLKRLRIHFRTEIPNLRDVSIVTTMSNAALRNASRIRVSADD